MLKKSQISVFVIISLIIVSGMIFIYSKHYGSQKNELDFNANDINSLDLSETSVKNYVQDCLDKNTKLGVFYLADKGGYIYNYDYILFAENKQIAYSLKNKINVAPSESFMKNELKHFLQESMVLCVKNYQIENQEYNLLVEEPIVNIEFYDESVDVDLDFPVIINKDKNNKEISKYRVVLPIRFNHILKIRDEISSKQKGYIDFEKLISYDVEINTFSYDKTNLIYSIYDNKSNIDDVPFIFNFAIESDDNSAPKFEFIPDFVLTINKEFNYKLNAVDIDDDELVFYSKGQLLKVDSKFGNISFTPNQIMNYKFDVCVKDTSGDEDCEQIYFKVVN